MRGNKMTKAGRNDPCSCGSGKKFKKCCALPKQHKILSASVLSAGATVGRMSSLFKNNIQADVEEKNERSSIAGKVCIPEAPLGR
jgi:hypothetical protein